MTIDPRDAASALSDIDVIVGRVRQSRIYSLASLTMVLWGVLVFIGYLASYGWPRSAGYCWVAIYALGIAGSIVLGRFNKVSAGIGTFDTRIFIAFVLFVAFGILCTNGLAQFTPRQLGAFWPIYFMLVYSIAGLWFGYTFVAIGFCVTLLTLIGYLFSGAWFDLWMAAVDGGGLILGGLWMRRA